MRLMFYLELDISLPNRVANNLAISRDARNMTCEKCEKFRQKCNNFWILKEVKIEFDISLPNRVAKTLAISQDARNQL